MKLIKTGLLIGTLFSLAACSTVQTDQAPAPATPVESSGLIQKIIEDNHLETIEAVVSKSTDGDTVEAITSTANPHLHLKKNQRIQARYLLLDTPESVGERAPMVFGKEASDFNKNLVTGKKVTLVYDKGDKTDKYGRQLCYVLLDDKLVQQQILEEGYGIITYVSPPNISFLSYLKEYEKNARVAHKNVWSLPNYVTTDGYNVSAVDGQLLQDKVSTDAVTDSGEVGKVGVEAYITKEYGGVAGQVYRHFLKDEVDTKVDEGVNKVLEIIK